MAMNIFQLPSSLLANLVRRTLLTDTTTQAPETQGSRYSDGASETRTRANLGAGLKGIGCTLCNASSFADVVEQRAHYRLDWHRYNVKAKLTNKPLLGEKEFMNAVADLSDSISGSESTESDAEADSDAEDAVHTALRRAHVQSTGRSDSPSHEELTKSIPRSPIQWFHSSPSTQIGIYTAVFPLGMDPNDYVAEIKRMQLPVLAKTDIGAGDDDGGRLWTLFMIAGGHFAGMVVRVSNTSDHLNPHAKNKGKHKPPEYEVLMHKTFHRYTTRRKQGGSQSLNDNAKGNAKSAGAQLRRYGEQALRDDIRGLLSEWSSDITASERIWIRANVSNKRIFYDYDDAPFAKNDERLRSFPFPTRRPTHTELLRCLNELVHAKISHFSEAELKEQDEACLASLPKPKPLPVAKPVNLAQKEKVDPNRVVLTKEQEERRDQWQRLLEMVRKGRMESLVAFWERVDTSLGGINARVPNIEGLDTSVGWTLLHVAAAAGQDSVVRWLLEEKDADPTAKIQLTDNEASVTDGIVPRGFSDLGQVPYEVASSKTTRDVFRRLAGIHPNKWDWLGEGRVPSILSKEMEEEQEERKKTRRKGLKDKMKEREEKKAVVEQAEVQVEPSRVATSTQTGGPQRLGGASDAAGTMGLTAEMRNRIERERRARAIEARLQRTNN